MNISDNFSLNFSLSEERFGENLCGKAKHTFLCSIVYFFDNLTIYEVMRKKCRAGQATDDNMAYAH